jgi:1,4-dihydroxy-6-naphthoate synthase
MKLTLGFSPCPNDTFIFDALVNGKLDTGDIRFEVFLEDVQTLNEWAQQGRLDVTKISYGVLPKILNDYTVLESGGALGMGVGPLLISKSEIPFGQHETLQQAVEKQVVAIPGENTTAHFLFSQVFPNARQKVFLRFDDIENWVSQNNGLGVIIHENRFTYAAKGLHKWADLGEIWERQTGLPIPLGGIVAKNTLPREVMATIDNAIRQSLQLAWKSYPELSAYVKCHAQEMEEPVMRKHIELYVNEYSLSLGDQGKNAIFCLLQNFNARLPPLHKIFLKKNPKRRYSN